MKNLSSLPKTTKTVFLELSKTKIVRDYTFIGGSALRISSVKVTFFANKWKVLKTSDPFINNINIASKEVLTAMKLNTLFLRAKFRDYYDLYVINNEIYSIAEMYNIIKKYMPQINKKLFQMALIFTDDIEDDNIDYLNPKYNVSLADIQKYFERGIQKNLKN